MSAAPLTLPTTTWLAVAALVAVAAVAGGVAMQTALAYRARRAVFARLTPRGAGARGARRRRARATDGLLRTDEPTDALGRAAAWLDEWLPDALTTSDDVPRLLRAGFAHPDAPTALALARLLAPVVLALVGAVLARGLALDPWLAIPIGAVAGLALPNAAVDRLTAHRQVRLRGGVPDALDLLVLCLEAGLAVDAALQRVARELARTHAELAAELAGVNRLVAAGLPRDEALRGLWTRTGVEELRTLAGTIVQAERWGTALARVLRIQAESMRTRRRQAAEAAAAESSVKMIIPLCVFLMPAFFAIVLGPAILQLAATFGSGK